VQVVVTVAPLVLFGFEVQRAAHEREQAAREREQAARERDAKDLAHRSQPENLVAAAGKDFAVATLTVNAEFRDRHVHRKITKDLRALFNRLHAKYILVLGPRGGGKTMAAHAAAFDVVGGKWVARPGVVLLQVEKDQKASVPFFAKFAKGDTAVAMKALSASGDDLVKAVAVCEAASAAHRKAHPGDTQWVPTVLIELDRLLSAADVGEACRFAKALACEGKAAAVFLIMSDAGAAGVPPDGARQVAVGVLFVPSLCTCSCSCAISCWGRGRGLASARPAAGARTVTLIVSRGCLPAAGPHLGRRHVRG
jgi:hypothetical protein